uniref:Uncharacterized protein n=1 Tax=Salix viminalis TaxID=40686 RepID=A0A6N2KLK2_SALVM
MSRHNKSQRGPIILPGPSKNPGGTCNQREVWSPRIEGREQTEIGEEKMIYRKWSLLTGPMAILGGIMGTAVAVRVLFFEVKF